MQPFVTSPLHGPIRARDANPPPFSRNPSSWSQRVPIVVLALIAGAIASYLALFQWGLISEIWDPLSGHGSETVLASGPSHTMRRWLGVPDAALGAFAYLGDAVLGIAGSTRRWQYRPWLVILFGVDVVLLGIVSVVLVLLQATVVGSWCTLCLVTAVISVLLIVLAYDEVWATSCYLGRVWRRTRSMGAVWDAFVGRYVAEADAVALEEGSD